MAVEADRVVICARAGKLAAGFLMENPHGEELQASEKADEAQQAQALLHIRRRNILVCMQHAIRGR